MYWLLDCPAVAAGGGIFAATGPSSPPHFCCPTFWWQVDDALTCPPAAIAPPLARSTLIVTEECLLHPSRNPHYGKAGIEAVLKVGAWLSWLFCLLQGLIMVEGTRCCLIAGGVQGG